MDSKTARVISDFLRILALLVVVGVGLYLVDPANAVVFQATGIAMFLVGGTHLTRRILFHRLDLQTIAEEAVKDNNFSAAVVFAAICVVLVSIMHLSMSVLK